MTRSTSIFDTVLFGLVATITIVSGRHQDGRSLEQRDVSCPNIVLADAAPFDLSLGWERINCVQIANADGGTTEQQPVKLTIRNPIYGRYSIGIGNSGYAWQDDADGIYYCASVGDTVMFDEYPVTPNGAGPTVSISAELLPDGEMCTSDVISYNGIVPIETFGNGDTTEIYWSHHRYYLGATHFEYTLKANDEIATMKNAKYIEIGGDPGDDSYLTIEIGWYDDENEKGRGLNAYFNGNITSWEMYEARVVGNEDWGAYFYPEGDDAIRGDKESCVKADQLTIANGVGDTIKFEQLTFATFLPWEDYGKFLRCVNGVVMEVSTSEAVDVSNVYDAVSTTLELNPFQVSVEEVAVNKRALTGGANYEVQITNNNEADAERVYCAAIHEDTKTQLESILGEASSISIVQSSITADCSPMAGTGAAKEPTNVENKQPESEAAIIETGTGAAVGSTDLESKQSESEEPNNENDTGATEAPANLNSKQSEPEETMDGMNNAYIIDSSIFALGAVLVIIAQQM